MSERPPWPTLAEAGAVMIVASLAIRLVPFRQLARLMGGAGPVGRPGEQELATIVRAIRAWSRRLPWRTLCFEEGLTAHWMLRRRRYQSTLHYGAATIDGELKAYVWVRSGRLDVLGCDNAGDYALLASFPSS